MKIMAIDCGKADTKICAFDSATGNVYRDIIPTRVTRATGLLEAALSDHEYKVNISGMDDEINGSWIVGSINGETSYSNSKKDKFHKILTLTAIARMTNNGDDVILSIGCPLTLFDMDEQKEEYFDYIVPNGRVDITVNGKRHFFNVDKKKCLVFPESFGAAFTCKEILKGNVGIVDIGGLNINASYFTAGRLNSDLCKTEKLGYTALISRLKSRINAVCDTNFNDDQVRVYLDEGQVPNSKEATREIDYVLSEYFERIEKSLKEWDLDNISLIFIGGTTNIIRKQIEKRFGKRAIIPEDANFVNAKGFLKAMLGGLGYKCPY